MINTILSGCGYGGGVSKTPWIRLKTVEVAPMPSASVSTATMVKPGFFSN